MRLKGNNTPEQEGLAPALLCATSFHPLHSLRHLHAHRAVHPSSPPRLRNRRGTRYHTAPPALLPPPLCRRCRAVRLYISSSSSWPHVPSFPRRMRPSRCAVRLCPAAPKEEHAPAAASCPSSSFSSPAGCWCRHPLDLGHRYCCRRLPLVFVDGLERGCLAV